MRLSPATILVLLVASCLLLWLRGKDGAIEGELRAKIEMVEAQRDARAKVIAALVSQAHPVDTVPVVKWFAKWDTLYLDTLDLTDTLKTRHLILTADSTIRACRAFTLDCVTQVANRDSTIAQLAADTVDLRQHIHLLETRHEGHRLFGIPLGCVAGAAATTHGAGLGAACGIPFP